MERFLGFDPSRHIFRGNDNPTHLITAIPRANIPRDPLAGAIAPRELVFIGTEHLPCQPSLMDIPPPRRTVREDIIVRSTENLVRQAVVFNPSSAGRQIPHVSIKHCDGGRRMLDEQTKSLITLSHRRIGSLEIRRSFPNTLFQLLRSPMQGLLSLLPIGNVIADRQQAELPSERHQVCRD